MQEFSTKFALYASVLSTPLALSTLLTCLRFMHLLAISALPLTLVHCAFFQYTKESYGQQAFSHSAPTLWNNLSKAIRNSESALSFKFALKTYLFQLYNWRTGVCVRVRVCVCVCDLYKCIFVAINKLCKVLGAPERRGAVQVLIIIINIYSQHYKGQG